MIAATVSGCVGQDGELKVMPEGDSVLNFSVASNEKRKGEEKVTWVRVAIWGKRAAGLAPYMTKGTRVCCTGLLSVRPYVSQGETKFSVELDAHHIDLLGGGAKKDEPRQERAASQKRGAKTTFGGNNEDDSEIPF